MSKIDPVLAELSARHSEKTDELLREFRQAVYDFTLAALSKILTSPAPDHVQSEAVFRDLYNDAQRLITDLQLGNDPTFAMVQVEASLRIIERELGWKGKAVSDE